MNLIDGELADGKAIVAPSRFELPLCRRGPSRRTGRCTFGIRPEDLHLEAAHRSRRGCTTSRTTASRRS